MRRAFVDCGRLGELVQAIPLLRRLAADGPLTLVGRSWARALLGEQTWLTAIHGLSLPTRRRLAARLRGRFDQVIVRADEQPAVLAWIAEWATPGTVVTLAAESGIRHALDRRWAQAMQAGLVTAADGDVPQLDILPARLAQERTALAGLGTRVLAVQVGSAATHRWFRTRPNLKGLPVATWAEFLVRLAERDACDAIVFHGSLYERREVRALMAQVRPALPTTLRERLHDWTGLVPLERLPAVLAASHALLSIDTGPAHIAAAVGCPVLAVYGPSDPARHAPRGTGVVETVVGFSGCQFCHGTSAFAACANNICLSNLKLRHLTEGWDRLVGRIADQSSVGAVASA